jgi:tRNA G46 methylase TrmB
MAGVYPKLPELFKTGKGLPYEEFIGFHDLMEEDSSLTVVSQLQESILPLAADIPERLQKGIDVLDAGCGKGRALLKMAVANPNSRFTGYELKNAGFASVEQKFFDHDPMNIWFVSRKITA